MGRASKNSGPFGLLRAGPKRLPDPLASVRPPVPSPHGSSRPKPLRPAACPQRAPTTAQDNREQYPGTAKSPARRVIGGGRTDGAADTPSVLLAVAQRVGVTT
jgi:hypothetical protein